MKLSEIQDLIKFVSKSGVSEVELETKEIKIIIKTGKNQSQGPPVVIHQAVPPVQQNIPSAIPVISSSSQPTIIPEKVKPEEKETTSAPPPKDIGNDESRYVTIKSPMIGTFYRSPSPDKPPYVNVGDEITPGQTVCVIEAMKLFNEIESDVKGRIVKVLVENASPVEYDQPLFLVDPS